MLFFTFLYSSIWFQAKFAQAEEKIKNFKAEKESKWQEKLDSVTPEAKAYLIKAKSIKDDMSLTHAQEHEQVQKLFDGQNEAVKGEIKAMFGEHHHGHHGHHGHGNHCRKQS